MKTEANDILMHGIDLRNRRIYFGHPLDSSEQGGQFTEVSVELAIRAMQLMSSEMPKKPIEIHMFSYGGNAYEMLRLHDEILSCPCQIKFYGGGAIMSAATWIMAVCDERYLYPNATIMVHDGSEGYEGKHTDVQINAAESKRLQNLLYDIYANNSRMPREFWEDVCQRDLYLEPNEAIYLGLADKIVEPKKRGNLRKIRQASLRKTPDSQDMRRLLNKLYARVNKVKIPKIELNPVIKEAADPTVVVDESSPTAAEEIQIPRVLVP
jgi:ATP-dependent Clp protease protease subunit